MLLDFDEDGRTDLLIGKGFGPLVAYRNTEAGFVELSGAANPFGSISPGSQPGLAVLDLDGDGRRDVVIGTPNGPLLAYRNTGAGYVALTGADDPFASFTLPNVPRPSAVDLDQDGDLDLVVGHFFPPMSVLLNISSLGAAVQVIVAATNDLPIGPASRSLAAGTEDTPRLITAAELRAGWTDADGDALSITGLTVLGGLPGTLVATGPGAWTFTPAANAAGSVAFQYVVSDGTASVTAGASLVIAPVNDAPTGAVTIVATDAFLSALSTLADADGLGGIAWQWQRFSGGAWQDITGATGPALGLADAPVGQPLRVLAQYTDGGGAAEQVVSATTAVIGSKANETLAGAPGDSLLLGQAGNDALSGGSGRDVLVGGRGVDTLTGGAEADAFRFTSLKKPGTDSITDFLPGTDRIEVLGSVFGLAPGALSAAALVIGPTATAAAPQFLYDAATGLLRFDANGTAAGGVTEIAILAGAPALAASDILVL